MKLFVLLATLEVAFGQCLINSQYATVASAIATTCTISTGYSIIGTLIPCNTPTSLACCVLPGTAVLTSAASISCATGYSAVTGVSGVTINTTCPATGTQNAFNTPNALVCALNNSTVFATCSTTCVSTGGGVCQFTNGTAFSGTVVAPYNNGGTFVQCAPGSYATNTISTAPQQCVAAGTALTVTCAGSTAPVTSFATSALAINYLNAFGYYYSYPGAYCNALCTAGGVVPATACGGAVAVQTYTCVGCYPCTTVWAGNTGQVIVVCNQATAALRSTCFSQAACYGLIAPGAGCGLFGIGFCPGCSASKKGLLGLLGLLGLIPLCLCCSLLCFLWLCCIRRRKTDAAVHFATFDAGAPAMAAPMTMAAVPTAVCAPAPICAPSPMCAPVDPCAFPGGGMPCM